MGGLENREERKVRGARLQRELGGGGGGGDVRAPRLAGPCIFHIR